MPEATASTAASVAGPTESNVNAVLDELGVCPESNLINVLQDVQGRMGYLPPVALQAISDRTKIPLSRIYGVVSFYAQFYTEPHGRHTVLCCSGTACHVKGGKRVLETVQRVLGIEEGESTADLMFYLETVACLGTCFLAPVMMIDDQYYGQLTPQKADKILRSYYESEQ